MPKAYDYLQEANEEINAIDIGIFQQYNISNSNEFITKQYQHINRKNFLDILEFNPDIIHFTGHGTDSGLVFDDGEVISPEQLKTLFINKNVQLLFLNACYSINQVTELKKLSNIKYIIGIKQEINEYLASDFAVLFYTQYVKTKDIPIAFLNAMLRYKFLYDYDDKKKYLQEFYPETEYQKLMQLEDQISPFEQTIQQLQIKFVQNRPIPSNLLNKIQKIIQTYDKDITILKDPLKFKKELSNISEIFLTLIAYAPEYGLNIDLCNLIRKKNQEINEIIKELNNQELSSLKKIKIIKSKSETYNDVIIKVFKKIYFDIKIDSIQNIEPLLPETSNLELFSEIVDIMNSILKSLYFLREKILQSFIPFDELYNKYLIAKYSNFIYHIEIDYNDLLQLLKQEMELDINDITLNDDLKINDYISVLKNQLQEDQLQINNGRRIINLKQSLEILFYIEEKLNKLFEIIVIKRPKLKSKSSFETNSELSILPDGLLKELYNLAKELKENTNLNIPQKLFPKLIELIDKINEGLEIYYKTDNYYCYHDIYTCYKNIYTTLILVKNSINNYSKDYPYLFPEILELCDFYKFRLRRLEKKQARDNIIQINNYFIQEMYEKVPKFSEWDGYIKDNSELSNKIGVAYIYLGKYIEAKEIFENILNLDKSNINALFNLGLTYQQLENSENPKKFRNSINYFKDTINKEPNHFDSLTSLGILYYKIRNYKSANKYIEQALNISENDNWRALLAKGCILSEGFQKHEEARDYFDKCEELNPNSILVKLNKSQNLIILRLYDEAEELLKKIRERTEDIEDRSTKIITRILLICLNFLQKKDVVSSNTTELINELLRLYNLKDSKLVDWNFEPLENFVDDNLDTGKDKCFLKKILTIPGPKLDKEIKSLNKDIQTFLNEIQTHNIEYIVNGNTDKIIIKTEIEKKMEKSEKNETEWYVWKVSVIPTIDISENRKIESVTYKFPPSFQDKENIFVKDEGKIFFVRAIGWEESKVEVELNLKDGSMLKKVIMLKKDAPIKAV